MELHDLKLFLLFSLLIQPNSAHDFDLKLIGYENEYLITDYYKFQTPQIFVYCACNNDLNEPETTSKSPRPIASVSILYTGINSNCTISIGPYINSKHLFAVKLNAIARREKYLFEYENGKAKRQFEVPTQIRQVITEDGVIFKFRILQKDVPSFSGYSWFYYSENGKNLKTGVKINDNEQTNIFKLGWYRYNSTSDKYEVNAENLKRSLHVDSTNCPMGPIKWTLKAAHYYNHNGILENEINVISMEELSNGKISDVDVDLKHKKVIVKYSTSQILLEKFVATNAVNFSAAITMDKHGNLLFQVRIFEKYASLYYVEIGEPGTWVHSLSLYHEKANQYHQHRISALYAGPQWICIHPSDNIEKKTCTKAIYKEEYYPGPKNRLNITNSKERRAPDENHQWRTNIALSEKLHSNGKQNGDIELTTLAIVMGTGFLMT